MRLVRTIVYSLALLVITNLAWGHGTEELNHHWDMPTYRNEMHAQIAIMAAISFAVFAGLWLKRAWRNQ